MLDDLEFKTVPEQDVEDAVSLMSGFFSNKDDFDAVQARKNLDKANKKSSYELLGVYTGKQLVGIMGLRPLYDPLDAKHGYELNNFIIKDDYKGLGIGQKFIDFAHTYMKQNDAVFCRIFVDKDLTRLVEYYKSSAYRKHSRDYYRIDF